MISGTIKITKQDLENPKSFAAALEKQMQDSVDDMVWYLDEIVRLSNEAATARPKPYWWHWLTRSSKYKFYIYMCQKTPDCRFKPKKEPT